LFPPHSESFANHTLNNGWQNDDHENIEAVVVEDSLNMIRIVSFPSWHILVLQHPSADASIGLKINFNILLFQDLSMFDKKQFHMESQNTSRVYPVFTSA
jgi:hypothetical protein